MYDVPVTTCCGRAITQNEFAQIKETVSLFPNLSHKELIHTVCELLDWRTPSGTNKWDACSKLLKGFEKKGYIRLPAKKEFSPPTPPPPRPYSEKTAPQTDITCGLDRLGPVSLSIADTSKKIRLWNEYTSRYHYLGYKKPFGYHLRYFIENDTTVLGCLLFSGAAKAISARDRWIGWTPEQRINNLPWLINNSRFLIFPWVHVKNLASHTLGIVNRRIGRDWLTRWGFTPTLMETFVDPERYHGTSYLAANWIRLGTTTGKGLVRKGKSYSTHPKTLWVRPIVKNFRALLCSPHLETDLDNQENNRPVDPAQSSGTAKPSET